jgi:hypothetical protein
MAWDTLGSITSQVPAPFSATALIVAASSRWSEGGPPSTLIRWTAGAWWRPVVSRRSCLSSSGRLCASTDRTTPKRYDAALRQLPESWEAESRVGGRKRKNLGGERPAGRGVSGPVADRGFATVACSGRSCQKVKWLAARLGSTSHWPTRADAFFARQQSTGSLDTS